MSSYIPSFILDSESTRRLNIRRFGISHHYLRTIPIILQPTYHILSTPLYPLGLRQYHIQRLRQILIIRLKQSAHIPSSFPRGRKDSHLSIPLLKERLNILILLLRRQARSNNLHQSRKRIYTMSDCIRKPVDIALHPLPKGFFSSFVPS